MCHMHVHLQSERVIVYKWLSVLHLVMCEVAIVLQSNSIKLFVARIACLGYCMVG